MPNARKYGPHQPEAHPNAVTVLGSGKWPGPETRPIPDALVKQRAEMNAAAEDSNRRLREARAAADEVAVQGLSAYPCSCGLWHFGPPDAAPSPSCFCPDGGVPVVRDE